MRPRTEYQSPDDTRLAEFAGAHQGVVSRVELLEVLAFTKAAIQTRVARAQLHRKYPSVYAVGHPNLSLRGGWRAAVLACGPGALLSHRDAAALHDLQRVGSGDIHVTSPSRHHLPGIRGHTARALDPDDVTSVDGISVTSVSRTLLDLAETLNERQLRSALEQAQRQQKLDFRALEAVTARNRGRHGIKPLTQAMRELTDEPPWTQSDLENAFRDLARAAGLPPPQMNVYVEGELVDAVWREHRLVVEIDGWQFHQSRRSFEDDRRRDAKLVVGGWRVVRFTYKRLRHEPAAVAAELRTLLRAGPSPRPAR
jgi:very-short-patch-repair endonuclease